MAYTTKQNKSNTRETLKSELTTSRKTHLNKPDESFFYELEAGVVVDVIRDETHPIFKNQKPKIERSTWPDGYNDVSANAKPSDILDYSWIGRVKVRMINSQEQTPIQNLDWVTPIETGIFEYPLVNEVVIISSYMGRFYYTRRLNTRNFINNSADFQHEHRYGMKAGVTAKESPGSLSGALNKSNLWPDSNQYGGEDGSKPYLGKYYKVNNKIRPLKHFEGDTIIQSRHGSSIRFGCFENDPSIDEGTSLGYGESYAENLGNPSILIRNRQRKTTDTERPFQYNILENINEDGSSIELTSGRTVSKFVPTITHTYDNVSYPRRGCVHKAFSGIEYLRQSKVGNSKESPTYTRVDSAARIPRPGEGRIN
mgnify:CR=1 FL=1